MWKWREYLIWLQEAVTKKACMQECWPRPLVVKHNWIIPGKQTALNGYLSCTVQYAWAGSLGDNFLGLGGSLKCVLVVERRKPPALLWSDCLPTFSHIEVNCGSSAELYWGKCAN